VIVGLDRDADSLRNRWDEMRVRRSSLAANPLTNVALQF
jgi:hypothetical protein